MDHFSEILRDMPAAEREALFASGLLRPLRMAFLMQESMARASVRPHPDPALATLAAPPPVAAPAEPERMPVGRNLTSELRESEAHRASQSRPSQSRPAARADFALRRPPEPTGTRVERHAHVAQPTDTVPVGRNLTTELQRGGAQ